MTPVQLQDYLHQHIPLSQSMGVSVLECGPSRVVLAAPLAPNINHRDTVFGGSASAVAILAAWAMLYLTLSRHGLGGRLVIQRNSMDYLAPMAGSFTAAAEAPPRPATERGRIVFLGTSLTAGLGVDPSQAYPALIQSKLDSARLPYEAVNAGVSGETSAGALRRIDWLMRQPVSVLVIETGANDGLRGLRVDSTRANIVAIVRRLRAANPAVRVLLAQMEAPPNLGGDYRGGTIGASPAWNTTGTRRWSSRRSVMPSAPSTCASTRCETIAPNSPVSGPRATSGWNA